MYDELPDPYDDEEQPDLMEQEKSKERAEAFIAALEAEAHKRVQARNQIENRWIADLRQYHGMYEPDTTATLTETKASQVFINLTRTKTDAIQSRLWDLLFPTDDKNWGIRPTPVPEMEETTEEVSAIVQDADDTLEDLEGKKTQAEKAQDPQQAMQAQQDMQRVEQTRTVAQEAADDLHEKMEEAIRRCRLMEEEISDQLVHSNYQAEARDAIEDACKLGTGILKGPIIGETVRQRWHIEGSEAALVDEPVDMPAIKRVDPWGFFPSIDARTPEESDGFYERHLMSKRQMRQLARREDIDQDAIRQILRLGPQGDSNPGFLADLQDLTEQQTDRGLTELFQVWEFTGPIGADELEVLAYDIGDETAQSFFEDEEGEIDPLMEVNLRIWFCQGHLLSVSLYPLDSQEPMYSVFNLSRDEYSMFGFGMPYLIRDPQAMLNGASRMLMNNAGLSTGPQIVINRDVVQPQDHDFSLRPNKVWLRKKADASPQSPAFETYDIPSHTGDLGGIIEMSKAMLDEMSGVPAVAQGEQGAGVTKTAQGMALLMNSANVAFKRYVKNFDDDMTRPIIRRMYHFNMQFSDKAEIKGDYEVDARGSSVLLVREMQANNLMLFAQSFGEHQTFGPLIKKRELLMSIMRANMIPADELLYTEREYLRKMQEMAQAQQKVDPQAQALQAKAEVEQAKLELEKEKVAIEREEAQMDRDTKIELQHLEIEEARVRHELDDDARRQKADTDAAIKLESERIKERSKQADRDSAERKMAVELAAKQQTGDSAGGSI